MHDHGRHPNPRKAWRTHSAWATVEQNTIVLRSPAFSRQWRITASVMGVFVENRLDFVVSKSVAVRRTFVNRPGPRHR